MVLSVDLKQDKLGMKQIKDAPLAVWIVQVSRDGDWTTIEKLFDNREQLTEFCAAYYRSNPSADLRIIAYTQVDPFIALAEKLNEYIGGEDRDGKMIDIGE